MVGEIPWAHRKPLFAALVKHASTRWGEWCSAGAGTYVYIPGGTAHTFENRTSARSGFLSINNPGGFENAMPGIVEWFNQKTSGS